MNILDIDPDDYNDPVELLEAILDRIIPDDVFEWHSASPEDIIVLTVTGRMFHVYATPDQAFRVTELDPRLLRGDNERPE